MSTRRSRSSLGGATGAVLGLCLGYLAIRRSGIYFAMITLALAQMVYFFCLEAPFTGGEDGIQQVPRGHLFGVIPLDNDLTMYWLVAACSWPASCWFIASSTRRSARC